MRKFVITLAVLFAMTLGVIAIPSETPAAATPTNDEPLATYEDAKIGFVTAHDNGSLTLLECNDGFVDRVGGYYLDTQGKERNSVPSISDEGGSCDGDGLKGSAQSTSDGTLYTTHHVTSGAQPSTLIAWKNGRQLWTADITAPIDCNPYSGVLRNRTPSSLSIGEDGRLYAILTPLNWTVGSACGSWIASFDRTTGASNNVTFAASAATATHLWTYEDRLLTFNSDNSLRTYEYDGTEVTTGGYPHQLNPGVGYYIAGVPVANSEGTFFIQAYRPGNIAKVLSYGSNGFNSTSTGFGDPFWQLVPTSDGYVRGLYGLNTPAYYSYDASTDLWEETVVSNSPTSEYPNTTGIVGMVEDESGSLLMVRSSSATGTGSYEITVDTAIPGSTTVSANLFRIEHDASDPNSLSPVMLNNDITRSVSNGYLYLSLCSEGICDQSGQSSLIYKIDTGGFGKAVVHDTGYADFEDTRLEYVAMGDSYSSGEGNSLYNAWTDRPGENECHRSSSAYSNWLAQTPILNLELTDFVACSGATSNDFFGFSELGDPDGKGDEPGQVGAVSLSTDVVTISLGGNDALFADFAKACILADCDASTAAYQDSMDVITGGLKDRLKSVYRSIFNAAPNVQVFVIGYPQVAPEPVQVVVPARCAYLDSSVVQWGDAYAARSIVDALNNTIDVAVNEVRDEDETQSIHFINPNNSIDGTFDGHDVCVDGVDSYFHSVTPNDLLGNGSHAKIFHPNVAGQYEYYEIIKAYMEGAL